MDGVSLRCHEEIKLHPHRHRSHIKGHCHICDILYFTHRIYRPVYSKHYAAHSSFHLQPMDLVQRRREDPDTKVLRSLRQCRQHKNIRRSFHDKMVRPICSHPKRDTPRFPRCPSESGLDDRSLHCLRADQPHSRDVFIIHQSGRNGLRTCDVLAKVLARAQHE